MEGSHGAIVFQMLAAILVSAVAVSLVLHRLRQSLLVGYFLCGMLLGPMGLGPEVGENAISVLAEIGVVLLMFSLGIEFSLRELHKLRGVVFRSGPLQVLLAGLPALGLALAAGLAVSESLVVAAIVAMSSTAVVLKIFGEGVYANTAVSRIGIGVALFQDFLVVLFMILLPALAGGQGAEHSGAPFLWTVVRHPFGLVGDLAIAAVKGAVFLALGWILSQVAIPRLLRAVSRTRSRELFTLMVLALCAGIAYLASLLGLTFAIGAFVAGLIVSETIYSHKILADILPFKDLFLTLFFVSVGMMVDLEFLLAQWPLVLGATAAMIVWKWLAAFIAGLISGNAVRSCTVAAVGLGSMGEFSIVLADAAFGWSLIPAEVRQFFLVSATLGMASVPVLLPLGSRIGRCMEGWRIFGRLRHPAMGVASRSVSGLQRHAVICGYGVIGRHITEALKDLGIPAIVIELNVQTVETLRREGQLCLFADAAQSETLRLARLEHASMLIVTLPGFDASRAAVINARELNPRITVVCRARYAQHAGELRDLGVDAVVHEEIETAFEMMRITLSRCEIGREDIEDRIRTLRLGGGSETDASADRPAASGKSHGV